MTDGLGTFYKLEETEKDVEYWINRVHVAEELRPGLRLASVLIVPTEGFRDYPGPVFPVGTEEIFHFLGDRSKESGVRVDLAVDDDKYTELALHSDLLEIGTFIATNVVLATLVNLLAAYIERKIWKGDERARVNFIITDSSPGGRAVKLSYEGPAKELVSAIAEARASMTGTAPPQLPPESARSTEVPGDGLAQPAPQLPAPSDSKRTGKAALAARPGNTLAKRSGKQLKRRKK